MSEPFVASVGAVLSADIAVPEHEREVRCYSRVLGLGGSELMHARDDDGTSQWAVLLHPNGAAFGVIPVVAAEAISPPVWMIYLPVGDLAESLRRVRGEGGGVVKSVQGADGDYIYAVIRDPVGAYLALTAE